MLNYALYLRRIHLKTISYTEMLALWRKGQRNGVLARVGYIRRGLFSAALEYSRMTGKIINPRLVELVEGVADRIRNTIGRKIFNRGLDRAKYLVTNPKVMGAFPSIKGWINEGSYVFWLGTELLTNRRSWVFVWQ
jgi:hypothetical protein